MTAVRLCRIIKGAEIDIRATPGTALINDATGRVVCTPPEGSTRLKDLLANWVRYLHDATETDPLIRMAVAEDQASRRYPMR